MSKIDNIICNLPKECKEAIIKVAKVLEKEREQALREQAKKHGEDLKDFYQVVERILDDWGVL